MMLSGELFEKAVVYGKVYPEDVHLQLCMCVPCQCLQNRCLVADLSIGDQD